MTLSQRLPTKILLFLTKYGITLPTEKCPSPDQNGYSTTSDRNMKTPTKNINLIPSTDNNEKKLKKKMKSKMYVDDLLQRAKAFSSQVQEQGLLFNLEEVRQDQKRRTVSVFFVDKRSCKTVMPTKDIVLHQLFSQGIKVQALIAGTSYAFWNILLPTVKEAVDLTQKTLENKEYFFCTEYMGWQRTMVSIYEVSSFLRDASLAAYMLNFGDIVSVTHDGMREE